VGGVDVGNGLRFGWEGGKRYTFCFLADLLLRAYRFVLDTREDRAEVL